MEEFLKNLVAVASEYGLRLVGALVVFIVGFKIAKLLVKLLAKGKLFKNLSQDVQKFAQSAISFILKALVVLTVISILGVPTSAILAALGTVGLAIGLGLQGSLGNFAGGLILLIFHPFHVGDFVDTGSYSGTVDEIGVYYTYIKTIDNSRVAVPNSVASNLSVRNFTALDTRCVDLTFSVDYSSDIEKVKRLLTEIAEKHELILADPAPIIRLKQQNTSSLDFIFRVCCNQNDYWTVYFDVNEQVKKIFDENNITIPFPQLDVHMKPTAEK